MGTQTQQDKAGNKYEVKPQYEELSKQIPPGSNHAVGHFLEDEICYNITHAQTFLKSFEVQQLRVSASSALQLLKWVANERVKQGEFSATKISENEGWSTKPAGNDQQANSYSSTKSAEANKNIRVKALQNDTVPTYLNDAVANTSRQQISRKQNNHLLTTALSPKHSICWSRENTQNDDASTNSNDAISYTSLATDSTNHQLITAHKRLC
ncbi:hexokinase-3-like [Dorcoceras hygrometricum]|uniref:Hexokinase-3-like n=1 Tax=Dorcoceras hygrometricum TaxID=472368 RepID=A0A2Z7BS73_9LAMI|nr:hexokinase-3-like [Dorcoceras hygrometricum]